MQLDTPLKTLSAADRRIQQLGDKMFEILADHGECTDRLLIAEGFSEYELSTYGTAARAQANSRFVKRVDQPGHGFTRSDEEIIETVVEAGLVVITPEQLQTAALASGLSPSEIRRNWQRIVRKLGVRIGTLPVPAVQ